MAFFGKAWNNIKEKTKGKYDESKAGVKMHGQIQKALLLLDKLDGTYSKDVQSAIPPSVLREAKGICFLSTFKGGFIVSASGGCGIVIAKLGDGKGWSAPSLVGVAGISGGIQAGISKTDAILILNSESAVKAFSGQQQLGDMPCSFKLGAELSVAAGPVGRTGAASLHAKGKGSVTAVYSYAFTKGLFAGVSLKGNVLSPRTQANELFYTKRLRPNDVLTMSPEELAKKFLNGILDGCNLNLKESERSPALKDLEKLYKHIETMSIKEGKEGEGVELDLTEDGGSEKPVLPPSLPRSLPPSVDA